MKNLMIQTLGCKVNQYESEALAQLFKANGYHMVSDIDDANVCIINTCSVTNMSDRKSRQLIRKCINGKLRPLVAVTGCYSEAKPKEAAMIEGVSVVIGTNNKKELLHLIEKARLEQETIVEIFPENSHTNFSFDTMLDYADKTRAIIKIQDGCNSFCSYCIIPYVRGRLRSRKPEDILKEAEMLVANGYKEIVLAGIHVCHYGVDLENMSLTKILMRLSDINGLLRIRLSSIEPSAFTDEFFTFYKNSEKLCPHFHISLQSGSDSVIQRMNRQYTGAQFLAVIKKLRDIKPATTITTDIIVGFPGETESGFSDTLKLIADAEFLKVHVFKYSKRNGTKAAEMDGQVNGATKEARSKRVIEVSGKIEETVLKSYVGKTVTVLFEEEKDGRMFGFSENYIPVYTDKNHIKAGEYRTVAITKAEGTSVFGVIV